MATLDWVAWFHQERLLASLGSGLPGSAWHERLQQVPRSHALVL